MDPGPLTFECGHVTKQKKTKRDYRSQVQGTWSELRVDAGVHYSKLLWHVPGVSCSLQERFMQQIMVLPSFITIIASHCESSHIELVPSDSINAC